MLNVILGGAVVWGLYKALSSERQTQHDRYQRKYRQVRRESEQHRRAIAERIQKNQAYADYRQAVAEHHAAAETGRQMYELYDCAKQTLAALIEHVDLCQQKIAELKQQRKALTGEAREQVHQMLEQQYQVSTQIRAAIVQYKTEKNQHLQELQQLNSETRRLKLYIRDQMGQPGREWFARSEMRRGIKSQACEIM